MFVLSDDVTTAVGSQFLNSGISSITSFTQKKRWLIQDLIVGYLERIFIYYFLKLFLLRHVSIQRVECTIRLAKSRDSFKQMNKESIQNCNQHVLEK